MQLPLFQGVTTERMTAIIEKLPFHFLKYADGETIVAADEPCAHIRFIISGKVRLTMVSSSPRITMSQTLSAPNALAPEYLFGTKNAYPFTATALGDCGILQLRKADYLKMLQSDIIFLFNILNYLSTMAQKNTRLLTSHAKGTVADRLAALIDLNLCPGGTDVHLTFRQKDICAIVGAQRGTFVNTLYALQDKGIISCTPTDVTVLDIDRLRNA